MSKFYLSLKSIIASFSHLSQIFERRNEKKNNGSLEMDENSTEENSIYNCLYIH